MSKGLIVKHNDFIESHYKLSVNESRILAWLTAQIKKDDDDFKEYMLSLSEISKLCNINKGDVSSKMDKITDNLHSKVIKVRNGANWRKVNLFFRSEWISREKVYKFILHPDLKPYLLTLRENFTKLSLESMLRFKHKYSHRVYELCLRHLYQNDDGIFEIELQEFREFLVLKAYVDFGQFNRRVLRPVIADINANSEILISIEPYKRRSRAFNMLRFTVAKQLGQGVKVPIQFKISKLGISAKSTIDLLKTYPEELLERVYEQWGEVFRTGRLENGQKLKKPAGFFIEKVRQEADQISF